MLHEVGDVLEGASLGELVERLKRLRLNSDNVHSQFIDTISTLLDSEPHNWKKVVTFFSSAAGFGINLHTNNMGHLATQLPVWMDQILQHRLQPWIDDQGGWVSTVLLVNVECLKFHSLESYVIKTIIGLQFLGVIKLL